MTAPAPREIVAAVLRALYAEQGIMGVEADDLDDADRILAALREAGALPQWRPIETAPKDGTTVLVARQDWPMPWPARYLPSIDDADKYLWYWRITSPAVQPTLWQPLPLPPAPPEDTHGR